MSTKSRLNNLYKTCPRIRLPEDVKILFVSDLHMNDGGPADDFKKNVPKFVDTLENYILLPHILILLGDIEDLWECPIREKIFIAHSESIEFIEKYRALNRLIQIRGNHDNSLDYPEAVVLEVGDMEIFVSHGHQGDLFNDKLWWIGQHFVRYLWVPLQWLGLHDAQKAKRKRHEEQGKRLYKWTKDQPFYSVFGHTHILATIWKYLNTGSWVYKGGEGIIFENGKFKAKHF